MILDRCLAAKEREGFILRRLQRFPAAGQVNSMQSWYKMANPCRVCFNFAVIWFCRYLPWLKLKNFLFRHLLGVQVGQNASVGLMVVPDVLFPQLISIGRNTILGYNCTILTHEFLVEEFRKGPVEIGADVLIGANTTILPGVSVGDGAIVGAGSLVNRDVPPGVLAAGVPVRVIKVRHKHNT